MKPGRSRTEAFTRTELVVVLAVIGILCFLLVPSGNRPKMGPRITCLNNLKQIGIAYRVWSNDNGDHFPADVPQTNGGWRELLQQANAGAYAWTNYAAMGNELGLNPKVLVCPADERKPASVFSSLANTSVSYFAGPGADDTRPQALLGGDRNLGPGTTPGPDYGYSPADGKGNDVIIKSPVCWSLKMHSSGNTSGAGNIMLDDGSAQEVTSRSLNLNWLKPAMTNFTVQGAATNIAGIRLIFP